MTLVVDSPGRRNENSQCSLGSLNIVAAPEFKDIRPWTRCERHPAPPANLGHKPGRGAGSGGRTWSSLAGGTVGSGRLVHQVLNRLCQGHRQPRPVAPTVGPKHTAPQGISGAGTAALHLSIPVFEGDTHPRRNSGGSRHALVHPSEPNSSFLKGNVPSRVVAHGWAGLD